MFKNCGRPLSVLTLAALLSTPLSVIAQDNNSTKQSAQTAYVDTVYDWGLWEFGPSPAAGGAVHKPRAASVRTPNVQFRPNDVAAFGAGVNSVSTSNTNPTPVPPPPITTSGPLPPGSTPPSGGPGDRF